jgi:hypothetical protein
VSEIINKLVDRNDKESLPSNKKRAKSDSLRRTIKDMTTAENSNVPAERRVSSVDAATVASRSLTATAGLPRETRYFAAYREVASFLALAIHGKTPDSKEARNRDLLPIGHPLSTRKHAMTASAYSEVVARWYAADPRIDDDARELVASAFMHKIGSPEQLHASARIAALTAGAVPRDILLDTIIAVGLGGNSPGAKSIRAERQLRNRDGEWIEMGGGGRMYMRKADGTVVSVVGKIAGNSFDNPGNVDFEISGDPNIPDGIYSVPANKIQDVAAILPSSKAPTEVDSSTADKYAVNESDLVRKDEPDGWEKQESVSFVTAEGRSPDASYESDDEYLVDRWDTVDKKVANMINGMKNAPAIGALPGGKFDKDKPIYVVRRKNVTGTGSKVVGIAQDWANVQKLTGADQDKFEAEKKSYAETKAKMQQESEDVKKAGQASAEKLVQDKAAAKKKAEDAAANGTDIYGNQLPAGWKAKPRKISDSPNDGLPADKDLLEYKAWKNGVRVTARQRADESLDIEGQNYDSWFKADEGSMGVAKQRRQKAFENLMQAISDNSRNETIGGMIRDGKLKIPKPILDELMKDPSFAKQYEDYRTRGDVDLPSANQKAAWKKTQGVIDAIENPDLFDLGEETDGEAVDAYISPDGGKVRYVSGEESMQEYVRKMIESGNYRIGMDPRVFEQGRWVPIDPSNENDRNAADEANRLAPDGTGGKFRIAPEGDKVPGLEGWTSAKARTPGTGAPLSREERLEKNAELYKNAPWVGKTYDADFTDLKDVARDKVEIDEDGNETGPSFKQAIDNWLDDLGLSDLGVRQADSSQDPAWGESWPSSADLIIPESSLEQYKAITGQDNIEEAVVDRGDSGETVDAPGEPSGDGLGFDETENVVDAIYEAGLISLGDRNDMMQKLSDIMQDEDRQIGFDDIEAIVDDLYESDKITLEQRNNIMAKASDAIIDQMPDEDGSGGGGGDRGDGTGSGAGDEEGKSPELDKLLEGKKFKLLADELDRLTYFDQIRDFPFPEGTEIVFTDEVGDLVIYRTPDGTYYAIDDQTANALGDDGTPIPPLDREYLDQLTAFQKENSKEDPDEDVLDELGMYLFLAEADDDTDDDEGDETGGGDGDPKGDDDGDGPSAGDTPAFDIAEFTVPEGAYRLQSPEDFEPEGRDGQDSSDYTDDPKVLANKFTRDELVDALASALTGAKDFASEFLDQLGEELDEELDEEEPKKKKPGPKKKKAAKPNVASGSGKLEFSEGEEFLPAEALYEALKQQDEDVDKLLADIYDNALGEDTNAQKLEEFRSQEEIAGIVPRSLLDDFDVENLDSEEVKSLHSQVGQSGYAQVTASAIEQHRRDGEQNEKIKEIAEFLNNFSPTSENETPTVEVLEKYIPYASSSDPEEQEAFRALFGMLLSADGGATEKPKSYTILSESLRESIAKYYGVEDSDKIDDDEVFSVFQKYGYFSDLVAGKVRVAEGEDSLTSNDQNTAAAMYRLMSQMSVTSKKPLYRGMEIAVDSEELERLTNEGGTYFLDGRSFSDNSSNATVFASPYSEPFGKASVVIRIDGGSADTVDISEFSMYRDERESLVWGNYRIEEVTVEKNSKGKDIYQVKLRKLTKEENVVEGLDEDYEELLLENEDIDMPGDYYSPRPDAYAPAEPEDVALSDSPIFIAQNWDAADLEEAFKNAVRDGSGQVQLEYEEGEIGDVDVEAVRDALQIRGVDTNEILNELANEDQDVVSDVVEEELTGEEEPEQELTDIDAIIADSAAEWDMENWTKVSEQLGSNEGGFYEDSEGDRHYVKVPKSDLHAENEVLASALYRALGIDAAEIYSGTDENGVRKTFSPDIPNSKQDLGSKLNDKEYIAKLQEGFAVDAWLANWDVAGLVFDNVMSDGDGNPVRVDPGGALLFRAQGEPKGSLFGNEVSELDTLRDKNMNPQSAAIFGSMTDEQQKDSASKLLNISEEDIDSLVDSIIFDDAEADNLKDKLKARRQFILDKYSLSEGAAPDTAKAEKPKSKPKPKPETQENAYVTEDGVPIEIGMQVVNTKNGQVGTVVKYDASNSKYVFVKVGDEKSKVKSTKFLQSVKPDGGGDDTDTGTGDDDPAGSDNKKVSKPVGKRIRQADLSKMTGGVASAAAFYMNNSEYDNWDFTVYEGFADETGFVMRDQASGISFEFIHSEEDDPDYPGENEYYLVTALAKDANDKTVALHSYELGMDFEFADLIGAEDALEKLLSKRGELEKRLDEIKAGTASVDDKPTPAAEPSPTVEEPAAPDIESATPGASLVDNGKKVRVTFVNKHIGFGDDEGPSNYSELGVEHLVGVVPDPENDVDFVTVEVPVEEMDSYVSWTNKFLGTKFTPEELYGDVYSSELPNDELVAAATLIGGYYAGVGVSIPKDDIIALNEEKGQIILSFGGGNYYMFDGSGTGDVKNIAVSEESLRESEDWRPPTDKEKDQIIEVAKSWKPPITGPEDDFKEGNEDEDVVEIVDDLDDVDEPSSEVPEVPEGVNAAEDSNGDPIFTGVQITDKKGKVGVVKTINGDNYAQVEFADGTKGWRSAKTVTRTGKYDKAPVVVKGSKKTTGAGAPPVLINDDVSWSESEFPEVPSLVKVIETVQDKEVSGAGMAGASALVDSDSIEDLDVRVMGVKEDDGADLLHLKFKLTSWAAKDKITELQAMSPQELQEAGITVQQGVKLLKINRSEDGNGVIDRSQTIINSPYGNTWTIRTEDGFEVIIYRANNDAGTSFMSDAPRAYHNLVQINAPADATPEQLAGAIALAGVKDTRPAVEADTRILAENRLMSIFDAKTNPNVNLKGNLRAESLERIKERYGLTADDVIISTGLGGRIETRLSPEGAQKIIDATGNPEALAHSLTPPKGAPDTYTTSEEEKVEWWSDWVAKLIANPLGGLGSTTVRWSEGIGINGMSSHRDVQTGGADYVFTTPVKRASYKYDSYSPYKPVFYFDPLKMYQRLDFYANQEDVYGQRTGNKDVISAAGTGAYEVMFKNRVGFDALDSIILNQAMRTAVIAKLRQMGITEIGGRPIEQVIVVGGSVPTGV